MSFCGLQIFGVTPQASHTETLLRAFTAGIMCNHTIESFTREGIYPYLLLPDTYFLNHFIQQCDSFGRHLTVPSPPNQSLNAMLILQPCTHTHECDVLVNMQCNASLHVISCHMYNECYMDNTIHTTYRVSWIITSAAYDFHTSFIHVNILCTYISTSTYSMSFYVQAMTHAQSSHVMAIYMEIH